LKSDSRSSRTMDFSNAVELLEKLYRIRERLLWRDELGRDPVLEADCDIGRLVGSFQRVVGHDPHVIGWRRQWARLASIDHGFALVDVTGMPVSAA
jgi:hypothetical protein